MSALIHQPSHISHQPSAISPHPSALTHQPSALIHQPSDISHQTSAISHLQRIKVIDKVACQSKNRPGDPLVYAFSCSPMRVKVRGAGIDAFCVILTFTIYREYPVSSLKHLLMRAAWKS